MRTADFADCVHVALAHRAGQPPLSQAEFAQRVDMSLESTMHFRGAYCGAPSTIEGSS